MTGSPERWATRIGIILAVSGSAVGLGNFLRFPGQAAANGGGAFLIPYFCALLLLGIPIGWAEWTIGRYGGKKRFHSAPAIMGVLGRGRAARYLGSIGVLIPLVVSFYYVFIEAWCLGYFWMFLTGGIGVDPSQPVGAQTAAARTYFDAFTGVTGDGQLFRPGGSAVLLFWLVTFAVNILLVYRGISRGIERFCSWAMPAMAICAVIVLARVLTLGTPDPAHPERNVLAGLGYMWNPDFSALGNFRTWLAAAGQVFFTLSVGFGVIINYASYLTRQDDVVLSGLTASATNELFEVGFGGLITLTASFVFLGLTGTIEAVATGSYSLGFATLPVVFAQMGPMGNAIGAAWFFMLFLAAITSSLSMYQPTLAFFEEATGRSRRACTAALVVTAAAGSLFVLYFSAGAVFRETLDFWVGTFLLFVMAGFQIACFSWVLGIERGWREAHEGALISIPRPFRFVMQYVAPAYLLIVFVGFLVQNLEASVAHVRQTPAAQLALLLVVAVAAGLVLLVRVGERRWRDLGLDLDDQQGDPGAVGAVSRVPESGAAPAGGIP